MGALLIYDVTSRKSFENVNMWLETIKDSAIEDIVILLIGNKIDLVD